MIEHITQPLLHPVGQHLGHHVATQLFPLHIADVRNPDAAIAAAGRRLRGEQALGTGVNWTSITPYVVVPVVGLVCWSALSYYLRSRHRARARLRPVP